MPSTTTLLTGGLLGPTGIISHPTLKNALTGGFGGGDEKKKKSPAAVPSIPTTATQSNSTPALSLNPIPQTQMAAIGAAGGENTSLTGPNILK